MIKTRKELIEAYLEFFKRKTHKVIQNASLIPENDPTVLFTTAGMHPLVPYLLSQPHPSGKRLCSVQKCIRTQDIDEVGDTYHHTFFEMLGNWSLGDYWKKEAIKFSFEFLTKILKLQKERLAVSCFAGDKDAPKDEESARVWLSLGVAKERIAFLPKENNWWGPAGSTGPCGPDTEMFYWTGNEKAPLKFNPKDEKWLEIWNNVFMQYNKDKRVILVDGMYCLYDENFNLNKELLERINNFNTHTILAVNGFREKGYNLVKNYDRTRDTNWEAFSLGGKRIKKDNPEYFKELIRRFDLVPEEIIYFDHNKKNVETAKKLGILSSHYTDAKSINKFIEDNLWAFIPLKQKNVDTGMGVERTIVMLNDIEDDYLTECFLPVVKEIERLSEKRYGRNQGETRAIRIIADHVKAAVFILAEGILPSNKEHGYVLRRLIRRAIRYGKELGIKNNFTKGIAGMVFEIYPGYEHLQKNKKQILERLEEEEKRFMLTLEQGIKAFEKIIQNLDRKKQISGGDAFLLYQSYGFPIEMTIELAKEKGLKINMKDYEKELEKHQESSRTATEGRFKSGLADTAEQTTELHTATHLLLAALRVVLKDESIIQKGSNITAERLRFDFSFPRKLTDKETKEIEDLVNAQIQESCEVTRKEMSPEDAKKNGAIGIFDKKYGENVSVYSIGDFSKEICAGPHVKNTCELGRFKIIKEEAVAAGIRRIKAILE